MAWTALAAFTGHPGEDVPEKRWEPGDAITDADAKALDLANKPDLAAQAKKGAAGETQDP